MSIDPLTVVACTMKTSSKTIKTNFNENFLGPESIIVNVLTRVFVFEKFENRKFGLKHTKEPNNGARLENDHIGNENKGKVFASSDSLECLLEKCFDNNCGTSTIKGKTSAKGEKFMEKQ